MITAEVYTTDGNVVRKIEQPLPTRNTRAHEQAYKSRKKKREKQYRRLVYHYQARLHFVCFSLIVAFFCFILIGCVSLQTSVITHMNTISQLEYEINSTKSYNASLESKINGAQDLQAISQFATEQLGMVPSTDHIVYYDFTPQDYMIQY